MDVEANPDVKAGVSLVLGTLPRERVLKNFTSPEARNKWLSRMIDYRPLSGPAKAPSPDGK